MNRIPRGFRVVVVGGLHHGKRGVTTSAVSSGQERIKVKFDAGGDEAWLGAYLLEPEEWHDSPAPGLPEVITVFEGTK